MGRSSRWAAAVVATATMLVLTNPEWGFPAVTVTAPAAGSGSASPTSDAPTLVGTDTWIVTSDEATGATLTISAPAFAHSIKPTKKALTKLNLVKLSGSVWSVGTGVDTSTASVDAVVTAASGSAGDGSFQVQVTFVPVDVSILPSGTYSTTITGTITANP